MTDPFNNHPEVKKSRFPKWLRRKLPEGGSLSQTGAILEKYQLNTVCEEAKCPNRLECYSKQTATFLALGSACTRACGFCDIDFAKEPLPLDPKEPERIAASVKELNLQHVVITMVARDDLPDQGALQIGAILDTIRKTSPHCTTEVLTSDFNGNMEALLSLLTFRPEIFNHNIETVRRLSPRVRHKATYDRTLSILKAAKQSNLSHFVKSGIMVGLGETDEEVKETIRDLHSVGCDIITIGQYLQASRKRLKVKNFVEPSQFDHYAEYGLSLGVKAMYCGPFIRSSYNAGKILEIVKNK
ncbi:MAG: lipoyl synthase [Simkaniaceae bacterium]|nr:lipoyl synthase [Simkaniaceae bacterium]